MRGTALLPAALLPAALLLGALTLGPETAHAQNEQKVNDKVLITRIYEAHKKGDWDELIKAFKELSSNFPKQIEDKRLVYMKAQAHYKKEEYEKSAEALSTLLEQQEDHVGALYLLAQIKARTKDKRGRPDKQAQEQAKDLLLQSARAGQYVLRDINSKEGAKIFGQLLRDSSFILRVMNASNEFQVQVSGLRNPFRSPLRQITSDGEETDIEPIVEPGVDEELLELERRIESLFNEIDLLAQERQVEELVAKVTELRQIMAEYGEEGSDIVKKKMEKFNQRLSQFGEVQLSIHLQIYINEGNQHLRAMVQAIRDEQFEVALERFEAIKELKDQMYKEEREVFHRNAEALFLRGKALADRARRLKRIAEFTLIVTGVIVAPPKSDDKDSAIINDRIYREGDTIIDDTTDEEIEGLRVMEIIKSTVRFRYEDTEFVRALKTP